MKIGIIGSGHMGASLGRTWASLGHEICLAGRNADRTRALAAEIGGSAAAGSFAEALAFADVVLVAVRYAGVLETLKDAGAREGAFVGKTIIDCSNPVEIDTFSTVTLSGISMAEQISAFAYGSSVVKAFHLCQASVWSMRPPVFDGRPLSVPICGNEPESKAQIADLIGQMGCLPVDLGPLSQARNLEPMAAVIIKLLFGGADPSTNFNLVDASGSTAVARRA